MTRGFRVVRNYLIVTLAPWWIVVAAAAVGAVGELVAPLFVDVGFSLLPMVAGLTIAIFSWSFLGPCGASVGQRCFALTVWSLVGIVVVLSGIRGLLAFHELFWGTAPPVEPYDEDLVRTMRLRIVRPGALVIQSALIAVVGVLRGRRYFRTQRTGTVEAASAVPPRPLGLWGAFSIFALPLSVLFTLVVGFIVYVNFSTGRGYTLPAWIEILSLLIVFSGLLAAFVSDSKNERLWGLRLLGLLLNGLALIYFLGDEELLSAWE